MTDTERAREIEAIRTETEERVHRAYQHVSQHVGESTVEKVREYLAGDGAYD